jgi:beta-lactamase superfamily II metal-dependent hydrolase
MKSISRKCVTGLVAVMMAAACATQPTTESPTTSVAQPTPSVAALSDDQIMDVWMLDVGQGSCVVIDCPDGDRPLLVDCGSTSGSDRNDREETVQWIHDALAAMGPPTVVVSHPDADHYSLIPRVVDANAAEGVWIGGAGADYGTGFANWATNVETGGHAVSELPAHYFGANDRDLHCGSAVSDILIANATEGATKNGDSVIVAVSYAGATVVLPGDAEGETETQALANRSSLSHLQNTRAIIVGSHHGASTHGSNGEAWASAWSPYAVVFSQKPASYGHPACDIARRYDAHMQSIGPSHRISCDRNGHFDTTSRMLTTFNSGDILVRIRPNRVDIYCQEEGPGCSGPMPGS